jgi:hypothetical protein
MTLARERSIALSQSGSSVADFCRGANPLKLLCPTSGSQEGRPACCLVAPGPEVEGKRVLLVDDISVTRRTLDVGRDLLVRAGATEVPTATSPSTPAAPAPTGTHWRRRLCCSFRRIGTSTAAAASRRTPSTLTSFAGSACPIRSSAGVVISIRCAEQRRLRWRTNARSVDPLADLEPWPRPLHLEAR